MMLAVGHSGCPGGTLQRVICLLGDLGLSGPGSAHHHMKAAQVQGSGGDSVSIDFSAADSVSKVLHGTSSFSQTSKAGFKHVFCAYVTCLFSFTSTFFL